MAMRRRSSSREQSEKPTSEVDFKILLCLYDTYIYIIIIDYH